MNKFNLLKYLSKWKYLIFAVCVLGALIVYKYAMYNQEYTASTVISYTGQNAADGRYRRYGNLFGGGNNQRFGGP